MKVALGTVQFGIEYGINNQEGIPEEDNIEAIFNYAWEHDIDLLDTASAYGNAENKIGRLADKSFKIVSKFTPTDAAGTPEEQLKRSLSNLRTISLYGYMAHNADSIIQDPSLWIRLTELREKGLVKKIGFSLYTTAQLEKLLDAGIIPDIVQLPYSLLDRKFESFLKQLKQAGSEIHARSVFLQGLYFMDLEQLPGKLENLKPELMALHQICREKKVTMSSLALNFVICNSYIDKVIIGVDNIHQLQHNISEVSGWNGQYNMDEEVSAINVKHAELLNPVNW